MGDGLVAFTDFGFLIGVIERPAGNALREPQALTKAERRHFMEERGMVELTAAEARRAPLRRENQRRREAFVESVREASLPSI